MRRHCYRCLITREDLCTSLVCCPVQVQGAEPPNSRLCDLSCGLTRSVFDQIGDVNLCRMSAGLLEAVLIVYTGCSKMSRCRVLRFMRSTSLIGYQSHLCGLGKVLAVQLRHGCVTEQKQPCGTVTQVPATLQPCCLELHLCNSIQRRVNKRRKRKRTSRAWRSAPLALASKHVAGECGTNMRVRSRSGP